MAGASAMRQACNDASINIVVRITLVLQSVAVGNLPRIVRLVVQLRFRETEGSLVDQLASLCA
jgi:hypothetical protein